MSWITQTFSSTLGRKLIMALTGLFLILFMLGHLAGNLQLLLPVGDASKLQFNSYAHFMTTNPAVKILSYITYISVLAHIIYSIILTQQNKKARPVGYAYGGNTNNSVWTSRNMGVLGTFILIFLVIHLKSFWAEMHWGNLPRDAYGNKDLYTIVVEAYGQLWYVILYILSMVLLGFHLSHGFNSAFQTLGLSHKKYTPIIKSIGAVFCILVPGLFAYIPIHLYLNG